MKSETQIKRELKGVYDTLIDDLNTDGLERKNWKKGYIKGLEWVLKNEKKS